MALIERLAWQTRTPALAPEGVVATGAVVAPLLAALAARDPSALDGLRAAAGGSLLCVVGPADRLPWCDGVRYCAPSPDAAGLWLPTTQAPAIAADLVLDALARRAGQGMLLLWPDPELVLPLAGAHPLTPRLLAWLATEFA